MVFANISWIVVDASSPGESKIAVTITPTSGQNLTNVYFLISGTSATGNPPIGGSGYGTGGTSPTVFYITTALVPGGDYYISVQQTDMSGEGATASTNVSPPGTQQVTVGNFAAPTTSGQNITFVVSSPQTVGSLSVSASSDSGLDVTISIVSGPATIGGSNSGTLTNSGTVVLTGAGTVVLAANQAGDSSYDPATEVQQTFTVTAASPPGGGGVPCFVAGTRILTPEGYKAVETIAQGSLVSTADGRAVPVKLYGTHLDTTTSISAPYTIPAGSFGLKTELTVSPMHAFQMRKGLWMIPKIAAKLSSAVVQKTLGEPVTYYHIECPQYLRDNLVVDGTVVESYSAKQMRGLGSPYTWSASLKGFTRASSAVSKIVAPQ